MLTFLRQFIRHPIKTGAISGASLEVANLIGRQETLARAKNVVELGSGTGRLTEKILENISKETDFFAVEINPHFVKVTKKRCPDAIVYNDSAINMKKYLLRHGTDGCDCIISGLPWAWMDVNAQEELLDTIVDALNPGGQFIASAYMPGAFFTTPGIRFRKMLNGRFRTVKRSKILWNNFPPYIAYFCEK
ncbi:MAG: methyltransferase domain-containing protein [archaeon]